MEAKGVKLSSVSNDELLEINRQISDFLKFLNDQNENIEKMEAERS